MPYDNEQKFIPSPAEWNAVHELQARGAPARVDFISSDSVGPFPGWTVKLVRFTAPDSRFYEAESWRLAAWPQISFVEMQALNLIAKG